jgi:colanic acid/amylovoran biosynthesis protein
VSHVIVDPGTLTCRNMGDVAMLQVAVSRIASGLPGTTIYLLTEDPAELARHCPAARPLPHWAREAWLDDRQLWGGLRRFLRGPVWRLAAGAQDMVRRRWPTGYRRTLELRFRKRPGAAADLSTFTERLGSADAVVVAGQGTLADVASDHARSVLATAGFAQAAGIPVFFFGQGIGPLTDPSLRRQAAAILPSARLVALREEGKGAPLARELGVSADRLVMTGDDAVELAWSRRPSALGSGLGIHLRIAPEAVRDTTVLERVRPVLQDFARARCIPLVPLPISHHRVGANDPRTIRQLLAGYDDASDGGATTTTPDAVIRAAGRCRVVVTGAYHAAVFALSQGIPAICLGRSAYYLDKFRGLRDQFGAGCRILDLDDPDLAQTLCVALISAWEGAESLRDPLLTVAERQVEAGRLAYGRLSESVGEASRAARQPESSDPGLARTGSDASAEGTTSRSRAS